MTPFVGNRGINIPTTVNHYLYNTNWVLYGVCNMDINIQAHVILYHIISMLL